MAIRYKVLGTDDRPLKNDAGKERVFETEAAAMAVRDEELGRRVVFCLPDGRYVEDFGALAPGVFR